MAKFEDSEMDKVGCDNKTIDYVTKFMIQNREKFILLYNNNGEIQMAVGGGLCEHHVKQILQGILANMERVH